MGHIKEPPGIDFIIKSEPLTDKERLAISEFIRNYKKNARARTISKQAKDQRKKKHLVKT